MIINQIINFYKEKINNWKQINNSNSKENLKEIIEKDFEEFLDLIENVEHDLEKEFELSGRTKKNPIKFQENINLMDLISFCQSKIKEWNLEKESCSSKEDITYKLSESAKKDFEELLNLLSDYKKNSNKVAKNNNLLINKTTYNFNKLKQGQAIRLVNNVENEEMDYIIKGVTPLKLTLDNCGYDKEIPIELVENGQFEIYKLKITKSEKRG